MVIAYVVFLKLASIIFFFGLKVQAQVDATIFPQGYNASINPNRMIEFRCTATEDIIQWLVNNISASQPDVLDKNVTSTPPEGNNEGTFTSSLFIPSSSENTNTSIQCRTLEVIGTQVNFAYSNLVFLNIQGFLQAPPNLSLAEPGDQLTRTLTWDAPETLDLTDIEPDIKFYQVCYNLSSDDLTCVNVSSSERREFIFPNVCVPLIFTVTAFNVVGQGNASEIVHYGSNSTDDKSISRSVNILGYQVSIIQSTDCPTLTVTIAQNVLDLWETCIRTFEVQTSLIGSNTTSHRVLIPEIISYLKDTDTVELDVTVDNNLVADNTYYASIIAISRERSYNASESVNVTFSTYDVQAVDISALPGRLELSCTFANGSQARSCILTVCGVENEVIDEGSCVNITITRSVQALTSSTRHVVSLSGVYSIREVIEVESDGEMTTVRLIEDPGLANVTIRKVFSTSDATGILAAGVWVLTLVTVCLMST